MKKLIGCILIAAMTFGMLTACGSTTAEPQNQPTPTTAVQAPETEDKVNTETDVTLPEENQAATEQETETPLPKTDISVAVMKGPTALGMVKLMEDNEAGTAANNYSFTVAGTADEISPKLIKGELQIAAVPCNLASVLYNKTEGKISMLAVNTLGVLYIVETGDSIQKVEDLKGKTIYSTGKGTTPEYTLRYLLSAAGLDPDKDVTIEFKSEATEIAALLSDADDAIASTDDDDVVLEDSEPTISGTVSGGVDVVSENPNVFSGDLSYDIPKDAKTIKSADVYVNVYGVTTDDRYGANVNTTIKTANGDK